MIFRSPSDFVIFMFPKETEMAAQKLTPIILNVTAKAGETLATEISKALHVDLQEDCRNFVIDIPPSYGKGTIKVLDFVDVIGALIVEAMFTRPVHIYLSGEANRMLRFNYCVDGSIYHRLHHDNYLYSLRKHGGSMTANKSNSVQSFSVPSHVEIRMLSIELNRTHYQDKLPCDVNEIPPRLLEVLDDVEGEELFTYTFDYSHKIHEEALEIMDTSYKDLIRVTHQEAKALEIIAQQYLQYTDDTLLDRPRQILRQTEMVQLAQAKEILKQQMQDPPTIPVLAKMVGLNQQKLKSAFKALYETTINNYLQKLRLEHGHSLLSTGDYSVKEVANAVGYQNHGFFTKKFVERYHILPSDVAKQIRARGSSPEASNRQQDMDT